MPLVLVKKKTMATVAGFAICASVVLLHYLKWTPAGVADADGNGFSSLHRSLHRKTRAAATTPSHDLDDGDRDLDNAAAHLAAAVQSSSAPCVNDAPPLIFESAGGWGDEVRGMVTAFYVALVTCKPFKVHWTHPFDLNAYFDMQVAQASAEDAGHAGTRLVVVDDFEHFRNESHLLHVQSLTTPVTLRTNAYQWLEVVRQPAARLVAEHYGLAGRTRYELFSIAVRVLFPRPSARMRTAMQIMLEPTPRHMPVAFGKRQAKPAAATVAGKLIGVQIRTGGVGESWQDPPRHPLSSVACFVDEVRRLCPGHRCTIFLTTDSRNASSAFQKEIGSFAHTIETGGDIVHTDRPIPATVPRATISAGDVWEKTFLDWAILSQVDVMLMSRSGFAWTAAWAGAVPYTRQQMLGEQCAWTDFDKSTDLSAVVLKPG